MLTANRLALSAIACLACLACVAPAPAATSAVVADLPWSDQQLRSIAIYEQAARRDGTFWRVATESFDVVSEIDPRFTAELACYLELFSTTACELMRLAPLTEPIRAEVVVFSSREHYQRSLGAPLRSRGQYDWSFPRDQAPRMQIRTFIKGSDRQFSRFYRPILNHECTHHLLQLRAGARKIPDLINEGVATFFQFWDPFRDRDWNLSNRRSEFTADLDRARHEHRVPDLGQLASCDRWDVDGFGSETQARYACAESFVGFCFAAADRTPFLERLLAAGIDGDIRPVLADTSGRDALAAWRMSLDSPALAK